MVGDAHTVVLVKLADHKRHHKKHTKIVLRVRIVELTC